MPNPNGGSLSEGGGGGGRCLYKWHYLYYPLPFPHSDTACSIPCCCHTLADDILSYLGYYLITHLSMGSALSTVLSLFSAIECIRSPRLVSSASTLLLAGFYFYVMWLWIIDRPIVTWRYSCLHTSPSVSVCKSSCLLQHTEHFYIWWQIVNGTFYSAHS